MTAPAALPAPLVGVRARFAATRALFAYTRRTLSLVLRSSPGLVAAMAVLTILGALARAGGLSDRANPAKIKFTRPPSTERTYSLDELKKESDPEKIVILQPGDVIEVMEKLF